MLRRLWRGQVPLADAFWTWAVTLGLAVNIAALLLMFALVAAGWPLTGVVVSHAIALPYNLLATVAVWRSANAYGPRRPLAWAARWITLAGMTVLSIV